MKDRDKIEEEMHQCGHCGYEDDDCSYFVYGLCIDCYERMCYFNG